LPLDGAVVTDGPRVSCGVDATPLEVFVDPRRFDYLVVIGGRSASAFISLTAS